MKKIAIASCILLGIGCVLAIGGWSAGGHLYGSYYGGAWHPVSETIRNITDNVTGQLSYRFWQDDDGQHSGWFGDDWDDYIDDTVDHAISDAINATEKNPQQNASSTLPSQKTSNVRELELKLIGGDFIIETGENFALDGNYTLRENKLEEGEWELSVSANEDTVVLTLPEGMTYQKVSIEADVGNVEITAPLSATESIDLAVGGGNITAAYLDARELDLEAGAGAITASLASGYTYGVEGKCSMGSVTFDGEQILSGAAGVTRIDTRRGSNREIELSVASGTIDLTTQQ